MFRVRVRVRSRVWVRLELGSVLGLALGLGLGSVFSIRVTSRVIRHPLSIINGNN